MIELPGLVKEVAFPVLVAVLRALTEGDGVDAPGPVLKKVEGTNQFLTMRWMRRARQHSAEVDAMHGLRAEDGAVDFRDLNKSAVANEERLGGTHVQVLEDHTLVVIRSKAASKGKGPIKGDVICLKRV